MSHATLLIELLTEELPPQSLQRLALALAQGIHQGLINQQLASADSTATSFATPRRLAVQIGDVLPVQEAREVERKGPSLKAGRSEDGAPSPALKGFAQSCGVAVDDLILTQDAKGQGYFMHRYPKTGETLAALLPAIVEQALKQLPVAKVMRWGNSEYAFVRPVHGLLVLHGASVLPITLMGLTADRHTRGHRFMGEGLLTIAHAEDYAAELEQRGSVVASFATRRERIAAALAKQAAPHRVLARPELLDEVTALVEWPVVYEGHFDAGFLTVPQDCLILSMQQHQKYFPLGDERRNLVPRFLMVSNLASTHPDTLIQGNERVLRARLSDARFFFEQDGKTPLKERLPRLDAVVYQQRLGSMGQRSERLVGVVTHIAQTLGLDVAVAKQAACLMKADLVTDMVGEFPELQGRMGREYARREGYPEAVSEAIGAQYQPRFAGDVLPSSPLGTVLALADKVETLVGIFGIGLIPTGDRDPFGLRRAALGVIRLLMENNLPLSWSDLLQATQSGFPAEWLEAQHLALLPAFITERLRGYLRERGYDNALIDATLQPLPERLGQLIPRLDALRHFRTLPEAEGLAAAHKRIRNRLKKTPPPPGLSTTALRDPAEQDLAQVLSSLEADVKACVAAEDHVTALHYLTQLHAPLERFFQEVLVHCPDEDLKHARLTLLARLESVMGWVGDLSCLKP